MSAMIYFIKNISVKKKPGVGGYNKATELAHYRPDTHVLSISDREGYFYDFFECAEQTPRIKADWLVRMTFKKQNHADCQRKTGSYVVA